MAHSSSSVGPLGVPMCVLVNIFCLTVPLIPRFLDLGRLRGDVLHAYTLMTLMPTFARLVVRGHDLKKFVFSTKTIDPAEIAKLFQEFNDVLKAKPYQRQ